jgi:hypothetical protein
MKLELKHLAPYLPYGLKFYDNNIKECSTLFSIDFNDKYFSCLADDNYEVYNSDEYDYKPILRPLSDLTKEIEVNGKKFIPIQETDIDIPFTSNYYFLVAYGDVEKLLQFHFDVFGLIEKELAIDINSLTQSSE